MKVINMGIVGCRNINNVHIWIFKDLVNLLINLFNAVFFSEGNTLIIGAISNGIKFPSKGFHRLRQFVCNNASSKAGPFIVDLMCHSILSLLLNS